MKVFIAGATGAIGRLLVPLLVEGGHSVVGMTRREAGRDAVARLGAAPVVADALDANAVTDAVTRAAPDVVVHELTALGGLDLRRFQQAFVATNRLRTEGTDNLLAAARAAGAGRFVAQSYFGMYERTGGPVKTEEDPLDPAPVPAMREAVAAVRHLEEAVLGASWTEGIVLRYGGFYGPGTSLDAGGEQLELVRRGRFPIVGGGSGVWSFIHIADAAEATLAATERGSRGVYNIVDDEPAAVAEWLPEITRRLGGRRPMRVPRLVGRVLAGEAVVVMMTELRGASNAKAKRELGWKPAHPSWRDGLVSQTSP